MVSQHMKKSSRDPRRWDNGFTWPFQAHGHTEGAAGAQTLAAPAGATEATSVSPFPRSLGSCSSPAYAGLVATH